MRKRTILFLSFVVLAVSVLASPVDPQRAVQVARQFVPQSVPQSSLYKKPTSKRADTQSTTVVYTQMMPNSNRAAFYIINVGEGSFVLVSADDVAYPILGYNLSNNWPVSAEGSLQLPEQIRSFFEDLAAQMEAAIDANINHTFNAGWSNPRLVSPSRNVPNLPDSVGPLLSTTWNQGKYYNALCPEDDGGPDGHAYAGCVATAMAQIVKYWGHPVHGRGIHSYDSNYGMLTVNYDNASYDFSHMPSLLADTSSIESINAIATLMYHCGVAANMDYGSSESSSFDVDARAGLINYYRFSPNMSYAEKEDFTNSEWNDLLRENIAANHPVMYSGHGDAGGHSFVLDGYKSNDYFHFNFGWGGYADGWYLTSVINPSDMDFSSSQSALVGIVPDNNANVILGQMKGNSTFIVDEPLRFQNIFGHNTYIGRDAMNACDNTVSFISADDGKSLVVDIINFEDQTINIYDGANTNTRVRSIYGGNNNDLSPVVSTDDTITIQYFGNLSFLGFDIIISQNSENRMVSNILSTVNSTSVELSWKENGNATNWQIEYGLNGFVLGEGTQISVNETTAVVNGLTSYEEYDFYIRPQNGDYWFGPIKIIPMPGYWIDVVDSQPEGYSVGELDNSGRYPITVTTAEGLAWWAKQVINQGSTQPIAHTTINIAADIDLEGYRWKPIPEFYGNVNGNGYSLLNMTIIEDGENSENSGYGFFRYYRGYTERDRQTISNLNFQNPHIKIKRGNFGQYFNSEGYLNTPTTYYFAGTGVLSGRVSFAVIENCGVKNATIDQSFVSPLMHDGVLVGLLEETDIVNSYASGNITSVSNNVGGLIGNIMGFVGGQGNNITNCYSSVTINANNNIGSISGFIDGAIISNCYGTDDIPLMNFNDNSNKNITDTMRFSRETLLLSESVSLDGERYSDLLSALNGKVISENNDKWRVWIADNGVNNGLPILGDYYEIKCPNIEEIVAINTIKDAGYVTHVSWKNDEQATSWRVKYWEVDSLERTATYVSTETNEIDLANLVIGRSYNICVQQVYGDNLRSGWGSPVKIMFDKPYWTDVVKTKPEGYYEDSDGNITITSAEGLAWLSCLVNGLHNQEHKTFRSKTVTLKSDINLAQYKWLPIGSNADFTFQGCFDGQNHTISNMYIRENNECVGLFGKVYQHDYSIPSTFKKFSNIVLSNSLIYGDSYVGGIVGYYYCAEEIESIILFDNCQVKNININGNHSIGAIAGYVANAGKRTILNCCSTGEVHGVEKVGGLLGSIGHGTNDLIANCYSTCDIYATSDNPNSGGLIGWVRNCNIQNGYAAGIVNSNMPNSLFGFLCSEITLKNLYGLQEYSLIGGQEEPSSIVINDTVSFSSIGILKKPITINEDVHTELLSALNAWIYLHDTLGIYRHWAADSTNENKGYPVFSTPNNYTLSLNIDANTQYGTVLGSGTYSELENVVSFEAIPQKGYHFSHWNDGNTNNPRIIKLAQDTVFTASFEIDNYSIVGGETVDVNYEFDFETPNEDKKWTILNFDSENRWFIHSLEIDNRALFISNRNGEINDYLGNSRAKVYAYTSIVLLSGQYSVSYDWRCNGELFDDYMQFALIPDSEDPMSWDTYYYLPEDAIKLHDEVQLIGQTEWVHNTDTINVPTDGKYKLIVLWCNGWSNKNTPPAAIDNIVINSINSELERHGFVLGSDTVPYLETVLLTAVPMDGYQFSHWNDGNIDNPRSITAVDNMFYRATFEIARNSIVFQNEDSTILQIDTLLYGSMPEYRGETPTKQTTSQYSYIFKEWTPSIVAVTGDAIYTATYDSVVNKYIVNFLNYNSDTLQVDTLEYGVLPKYREIPSRATSAQYTYTFVGWSPDIAAVTGSATYIAQYDSVVNKYNVNFLNYDSDTLQVDTLEYGVLPKYRGIPSRATSAQYTYTFVGWSPDIAAVTGSATYIAQYDSVVNKYNVNFLNYNNDTLQVDTLEYGVLPEYRGSMPTREADDLYLYTFVGWTPDIVPVVGATTYVATFDASPNTGVLPISNGSHPQKVMIDGKLYFILPDGTRLTPAGIKVE